MSVYRMPWYFDVIAVVIGLLLIAWLGLRVAAAFKQAGFGLTQLSEFGQKVFTKTVFGAVFALGLLLILGLSVHHFVLGVEIEQLADGGVMRGWVTLLFSIVGAAMFIAITVGVFTYPDLEKEAYDRVRGIMMQLVTILGTIIGFYFGSVTVEQSQDRSSGLTVVSSAIPTSITATAGDSVLVPLDVTASGGTAPFQWEVTADDRPLTLSPDVISAAAAGRLDGSLWIDTTYPDRLDLKISVRDHDGHTRTTTHRITLLSASAPTVTSDSVAAATGPSVGPPGDAPGDDAAPPDTPQLGRCGGGCLRSAGPSDPLRRRGRLVPLEG